MILKGYLFSVLYGALCLLMAAVLHKVGVPKKITRKLVHIFIGFEWVILYNFVGATYHFLAVCLAFLAMLIFVYKKRLMPMISSEGDNAPGTVYYAVAMSVMATVTLFLPSMIVPFGIGVFCTSLGDGLAGLVGQSIPEKINPKIYGSKSLAGGLTNLTVCFAVAMCFSEFFGMNVGILGCAAVAVFALELELFTAKGLDNITITLGTAALAFAFSYYPDVWNYIIPILLTPVIIAFVKSKRALTWGGLISAVVLDVAISLTLGNSGFLILFSFFAIGLITDKIKKTADKKRQNQNAVDKSRGAVQVLSNGAVGMVCAVAFFLTSEKAFLIAFCASFAEALADTAASGIGAFSDKAFDPFRFKRCESGLSGGMSLIGTLASLLGALLIALASFSLNLCSLSEMLVIVFSGFFGGVFDSLLGSLVQVKYRCKVCSKIIEKKVHCGENAEHYRGVKFVDNNLVNFLGTLFSALVAVVLTV